MLRHVQHCNVNCRDLDRSVAFYRDELGLAPLIRTNPEAQDGTGFGIDGDARWDAWMMSDGRANPVVDLLEWQTPRPVGRPHAIDTGLGMVALRVGSPTVDTTTEILDPDGTPLVLEPADAPRLLGVRINVRDVESTTDWYRSVLGLAPTRRGLRVGGDDFEIEIRGTDGDGAAYDAANHLGIFRMAFLVDDAAAAVAELRRNGAACPDPVWLDMGPTIPIDGLWAAFFRDPEGTCLEVIESPTPS